MNKANFPAQLLWAKYEHKHISVDYIRPLFINKLEIRYRKNLAKLIRVSGENRGKQAKGKKNIAGVASVSVRFRSKERGTRVKTAQAKEWGGGEEERKETFFLPLPLPLFHFLALVSFLAQPKPRILFLASFLGLFLLRNQTETLATQAIKNINKKTTNKQKKKCAKKTNMATRTPRFEPTL